MSKYILEIKPEYEDSFKGVMILGAKDSNLFVDTLAVENLEELNSDYINEHFGDLQDDAYQRGLDDAWKAAKKIVLDTNHGGIALSDLSKIFGGQSYTYIMNKNTAQEAIAKLKAYEEKQKADDEIKVGDEVKPSYSDITGVVTLIDDDTIYVLWRDGSSTGILKLKEVTKTGRHFDIASILEEMRHD